MADYGLGWLKETTTVTVWEQSGDDLTTRATIFGNNLKIFGLQRLTRIQENAKTMSNGVTISIIIL
jgi:hypothetical protein